MSPSPNSNRSGPSAQKDDPSNEAVQPDGPKGEASPRNPLRSRLVSRRWELWYLLLGVWMLFLLGQIWYESSQVASIPYSRFLEYQQEGRVSDLVVDSDQPSQTRLIPKGDGHRLR